MGGGEGVNSLVPALAGFLTFILVIAKVLRPKFGLRIFLDPISVAR